MRLPMILSTLSSRAKCFRINFRINKNPDAGISSSFLCIWRYYFPWYRYKQHIFRLNRPITSPTCRHFENILSIMSFIWKKSSLSLWCEAYLCRLWSWNWSYHLLTTMRSNLLVWEIFVGYYCKLCSLICIFAPHSIPSPAWQLLFRTNIFGQKMIPV